ncbi:MAG TPA: hypothetical protein PLC42_05360 [Parachlamydiaceae bacterium]|nr:hypothetical protein [Parachlamydiaceae bacterium]
MKFLSSLILIIYLAPSMLFSMSFHQEPLYCKLAAELRAQSAKKLEKKHQMSFCGTAGGMMDNINLLGFSFLINRPMTKNEVRMLAVSSTQDFLNDINQDEKVRQYLKIYPFDIEHIEITFLFRTHDQGTVYHPNLAVVSVYNGKIKYSTNNPLNDNRFLVQETETFEDAVKILNGEIPAPESQIK